MAALILFSITATVTVDVSITAFTVEVSVMAIGISETGWEVVVAAGTSSACALLDRKRNSNPVINKAAIINLIFLVNY